jgi:hypothetical protein
MPYSDSRELLPPIDVPPEPAPPPIEFRRAEYDYLVKWLGRLTDDDAVHAFPILRQMRDSYHD